MKLLTLKSIVVNTLPPLIPQGTLTTVACAKTYRRGTQETRVPAETGGKKNVREFTGLHSLICHFSVSGTS